MQHHKQGNAPGIDTPASGNGLTTPHSQPATIHTLHATKFIAKLAPIGNRFVPLLSWLAITVTELS
jgi:hypothetical protein